MNADELQVTRGKNHNQSSATRKRVKSLRGKHNGSINKFKQVLPPHLYKTFFIRIQI